EVVQSRHVAIFDPPLIVIVLHISVVMIPIEPVERRRGEAVERLEIASMIGHHVEHDVEALRMSRIDQLPELAHVAEVAVDAIEVMGPYTVVGFNIPLYLRGCKQNRSESHPFNIAKFFNPTWETAAVPFSWTAAAGFEPAVVIIAGVSVGEAVG